MVRQPKPMPPLKKRRRDPGASFGTATVYRLDRDGVGAGVLPPRGSHQTDPFAAQDAPGFYHCPYCGQNNAAEREGCRGCGAPRPEVA